MFPVYCAGVMVNYFNPAAISTPPIGKKALRDSCRKCNLRMFILHCQSTNTKSNRILVEKRGIVPEPKTSVTSAQLMLKRCGRGFFGLFARFGISSKRRYA